MPRKRSRLTAKVPEPNDNVTMTAGHKVLVEAVFEDTGLNAILDGLKRNQGESVACEVRALVANSAEMMGISVNRLDRILSTTSSVRSTDWAAEPPVPCTARWRG